MSTEQRRIVLASRASQLAQVQTNVVLDTLKRAFPERVFDTSFISTQDDKNQSQELEVALLDREVDMLVHCLKHIPTALPKGCVLGAILEREHGEDSLVVKKGYTVGGKAVHRLDDLPAGAVVGTRSVRTVAQLKRRYPDLVFKDVQGNIDTRLAILDDPDGPYTALILAKAGLVRLGFGDRVTSDVIPPTLFRAVGQGALAVEIRTDDDDALTHWQTEWCCRAEREFLRVLESGRSVPVGVHSELKPAAGDARQGKLRLVGTITALDGQRHVQREVKRDVSSPEQGEELGAQLAKALVELGGGEILGEITKDCERRAGEAEENAQQAT